MNVKRMDGRRTMRVKSGAWILVALALFASWAHAAVIFEVDVEGWTRA